MTQEQVFFGDGVRKEIVDQCHIRDNGFGFQSPRAKGVEVRPVPDRKLGVGFNARGSDGLVADENLQ
eukprot:4021598-Ditylum_brightwellii.AAC.1